jgi:tRNA (guanine37-N1)-methyltransferase
MKIQIITLFPEMFDGVLNTSMLWKAQEKNLVEYNLINLRDFGLGPRKQVDDTPYGGGDGMVLKPEPLFAAVEHTKKKDPEAKVLLMTPRGDMFNQEMAREFAATENGLIIICGRYEGYDERITTLVDKQVSVGLYVLTGGELPASFTEQGEIEHPQYTRPEEFRGLKVPDVLLSGHHAEIERWRKASSK